VTLSEEVFNNFPYLQINLLAAIETH